MPLSLLSGYSLLVNGRMPNEASVTHLSEMCDEGVDPATCVGTRYQPVQMGCAATSWVTIYADLCHYLNLLSYPPTD